MTGMLPSCLSRGIWRASKQGCFRNYTPGNYIPGAKAQAGQSPLLLGCLRRKGFWGDGAAGTWSSVSTREHGQGPVRSRKPPPPVCPWERRAGWQENTHTCPLMADAFFVVRQAASKHLYSQLSQVEGRESKLVCSQG